MEIGKSRIDFYSYGDTEMVLGECVHTFPVHIHESLCVGVIISGMAEWSVNGEKTILSAGDSYTILPYMPHALSAVDGKPFQYSVLCFKKYNAVQRFSKAIASSKDYIEGVPSVFNMDVLSDRACLSKYHLIRTFKEEVGVPPYQLYNYYRVKKVRRGLEANTSFLDLVYNLGFTDQSHLCRIFKKYMGISPKEYIRACHQY